MKSLVVRIYPSSMKIIVSNESDRLALDLRSFVRFRDE